MANGIKTKPKTRQELEKTIEELTGDVIKLSQMLEREQRTARVPKEMTVVQYNSLIDHLNANRPEPLYSKDVPLPVELSIVKDVESESHVN